MTGPIIEADFVGESKERRWITGSYRRNRSRIERLIKKQPRPENYLLLALLEARKHYWQRSQSAVEKALLLDPDNRNAALLLAQILEARGELKAAAAAYQALCRKHPRFSKAYREYARYLMTHTDSVTLAQNLLLMSLELDPKDSISHTLLAEIYLFRGKTGQALLHLKLADQYYKAHPGYHLRTAKLFMEMKRYEEAVQQLRIALRLDPKNKVIRSQFFQALKAANTPGFFLFWKRWVI
jgi:tetratricopeptide (TPR) repeat protein